MKLSILIFFTLAQLALCDPYPWLANVCNESIPIKKDVIVDYPVQYEIKVQSMCGILPCVKTRIETRTDQRIKTIVRQVTRPTCCPGYIETPERECAPICLDSCENGAKCIAPNACQCQPSASESAPGFAGPTCKRFVCLGDNRWGSKCERECQLPCSGNSYCAADTGKCLCFPGWRGPNCTLECNRTDEGCEQSKLPPIMEPDANLLSRLQTAEALVLVDERDAGALSSTTEASDGDQSWQGFAPYLVVFLSAMVLSLLVAFLTVKKRYDAARKELYYTAAAMAGASTSSGPESDYSDSTTYYSTGPAPAALVGGAGNMEKNLSFATATRNILLAAGAKGSDNQANQSPKVTMLSPRVEASLIRSQKASEQNIYSEVNMASANMANRSRAATPTPARRGSVGDHYQVPKSLSAARVDDKLDEPAVHSASAGERAAKPGDELSIQMDHYDESNIYEELKPRNSDDRL